MYVFLLFKNDKLYTIHMRIYIALLPLQIPAWANAILDHNEENTANPINLAGVVIGNGCVNDTVQNGEQYINFLHAENLIPADSKPK